MFSKIVEMFKFDVVMAVLTTVGSASILVFVLSLFLM
jgi:hypothetical protein